MVRVARSAFACALPRPSAIASAKLANRTVSQSQIVMTPTNQSCPYCPRASSRKRITVVIALQVLGGNEDGQADSYMAVFLGMVFLLLAVAFDIYRREFMPDELIHKIRRPKIVLRRAFR